MQISPTSSRRSAPPIPGSEARGRVTQRRAPPLCLTRLPGRWRSHRHALLGLLAGFTGWAWLGYGGALLLVLWWWSQRPRAYCGVWLVHPAAVRSLRTGCWRTRLTLRGGAPLEIFHDELSAADLARLRRQLKRQLAAG